MPYDAKIAIIGNGQVAKGVMRILHGLGAKQLDVYDYFREDLFRKVMFDYDIIVNCVFWDTSEYSCAVKPPFRNAGYRRSGNGVPQLLLAN